MGTGRIRATVVAICFFALGHGGAATAGRAQEGGASGTKQSVARSADATGPQSSSPPPAANTGGSKTCVVTDDSAAPLSAPMAEALKLYRKGKVDEAIAAYNAILPAGGAEAAAAYAGIARAYLDKNDPDQAFEAAQKAVALTPDRPPAIVALGEVYFRQGKIEQAAATFRKPLLACDLDARACLGLYRVYAASVNWKHAKTNIDQAYKLDPRDPDISYYYMQTRSVPERIRALQAELDDPDSPYDDEEK